MKKLMDLALRPLPQGDLVIPLIYKSIPKYMFCQCVNKCTYLMNKLENSVLTPHLVRNKIPNWNYHSQVVTSIKTFKFCYTKSWFVDCYEFLQIKVRIIIHLCLALLYSRHYLQSDEK